MPLSRRTVLSTVLPGALSSAIVDRFAWAAVPTIRVGVLPFGTSAWELEVIRRNGFDMAHGIAIEPVNFASPSANQAALLAGSVDAIFLDWLWVVGRRADGADWTFAPVSSAAGSLVARTGSPLKTVADLAGTHLGIVGPLDKNWLILQAYATRNYDMDLDRAVKKIVAPPPELLSQLRTGQVDSMVTFWPFAAKAEARGMRHIVSVEDAVRELGVNGTVPFSGYVFSRAWGENNRTLIDGFLSAGSQARALLGTSDSEWAHLKPMLNVDDDVELEKLKAAYRRGVIRQTPEVLHAATAQLYRLLAEIGGLGMVGATSEIPSGTFW